MLLQFVEKVGSSMHKGIPKVVLLDPFADMGRTGVDSVCFFSVVGSMSKIHVSFIGPTSVKTLKAFGAQGPIQGDRRPSTAVFGRGTRQQGGGKGEGTPLPRVGEEGLKPETTPTPPQPRGLAGL